MGRKRRLSEKPRRTGLMPEGLYRTRQPVVNDGPITATRRRAVNGPHFRRGTLCSDRSPMVNISRWTHPPARRSVLARFTQFCEPALEEALLGFLTSKLKGSLVGGAGFAGSREPAAEVGAGGVGKV